MKTLTFTEEEIEMLCRGVLAIPDDGEDLTPRIALHRKLTATDTADLDDVHLACMVEQGMPVSAYLAEKARREVVR